MVSQEEQEDWETIDNEFADEMVNLFRQANADDEDEEDEEESSHPTGLEDEAVEEEALNEQASEEEDEADEDDDESEEEEAEDYSEGVVAEEDDDETGKLDLPALRKRLREASKESKRLARELDDFRERQAAAQQHQQAAALQKPDQNSDLAASQGYTAEELLTYLGRVEQGEADGKFRAQALSYLEYKDPTEIIGVVQRARMGQYGTVSRDIELVSTEALSLVQAVSTQRQAEIQSKAQWAQVYQQSLREVQESGVSFLSDGNLDRSNEASVAYEKAGREMVGMFPSLANEARAPGLVLRYMQLKNKAEQADRVPELEARIKELEGRVAKKTKSLPKGKRGSKASAPTGKSDEDIFMEELRTAWPADLELD